MRVDFRTQMTITPCNLGSDPNFSGGKYLLQKRLLFDTLWVMNPCFIFRFCGIATIRSYLGKIGSLYQCRELGQCWHSPKKRQQPWLRWLQCDNLGRKFRSHEDFCGLSSWTPIPSQKILRSLFQQRKSGNSKQISIKIKHKSVSQKWRWRF